MRSRSTGPTGARPAIVAMLALFEQVFPSLRPTEKTVAAWSLALEELTDEEIGWASTVVVKSHRFGAPNTGLVYTICRGETHKLKSWVTDNWNRRILDAGGGARLEGVEYVRYEPGDEIPDSAEPLHEWVPVMLSVPKPQGCPRLGTGGRLTDQERRLMGLEPARSPGGQEGLSSIDGVLDGLSEDFPPPEEG